MIQILELFGGIGSPRVALRNLGIDVKSIDYVEIDKNAVMSYNEIFKKELEYRTQNVKNWNLKPDILVHGSPCQNFSIAGKQQGADEGSGTESSLMWETINIIRQMGIWKPRVVIWENVKNVLSKHMIHNFNKYLNELNKLGYTNSFEVLDARDFGLPQARKRVFTISCIDGTTFDFDKLKRKQMRNLEEFLETDVSDEFLVTQPSVLAAVGKKGIKRATVIRDYAYTITERQDRCPAQIIEIEEGKYRYLTPQECWLLQGYSKSDYLAAAKVNSKRALYKQAGNSIAVPIFESIFEVLLR